eukprot:5400268-Alexandrium_andersonii.AAC.1
MASSSPDIGRRKSIRDQTNISHTDQRKKGERGNQDLGKRRREDQGSGNKTSGEPCFVWSRCQCSAPCAFALRGPPQVHRARE